MTPRQLSARLRRQPRPTGIRLVGHVLAIAGLVVLALVFLAGLAVALVVGGPVLLVIDWIRKRRFIKRHLGQSFLMVRRKRRWGDFIVNNVEPALPPDCRCLWEDSREPRSPEMLFVAQRLKKPKDMRRPYLVSISSAGRVRLVPLHDELLPLKTSAQKSTDTRRAVADVIGKVLES